MSRKRKRQGGRGPGAGGQGSVAREAGGLESHAPAMVPQAITWGWSGYAGANQSEDRGMVHWPTIDSTRELDSYSRGELCLKLRWLGENNGIFKGFLGTAADLLGWLTPQPLSGNKDWDDEMAEAFRTECGYAGAFDVDGKFNYKTAQPMLTRSALETGDVFTVLTKSASGAARFAFYEGYQLANPKNASERWRDGVCEERPGGRHLAYGFRDGKTGEVKVIPAKDVIYTGEFTRSKQPRAVPRLAHAINDGLDITEINGFTKKAIKTAALFGIIRQVNNPNVPRSHMGIAGPPSVEIRERPGNTAAGEPATVVERVESSNVFGSGTIPRLPSGEEAKILHDARPHPNQKEFKGDLIRQIAVGYGLPYEVVWHMAGITGPGVRFVLDMAGRWVEQRTENLLTPWGSTVYLYWAACKMKYGGMRRPTGEKNKELPWWKHDFLAQRDLTIDRGRDLKGRMEAVAAGLETEDIFCEEMYGRTASEMRRKHIQGVKEKMDLCAKYGVPYETAYPPRAGAAAKEEEEESEEGKAE